MSAAFEGRHCSAQESLIASILNRLPDLCKAVDMQPA